MAIITDCIYESLVSLVPLRMVKAYKAEVSFHVLVAVVSVQ